MYILRLPQWKNQGYVTFDPREFHSAVDAEEYLSPVTKEVEPARTVLRLKPHVEGAFGSGCVMVLIDASYSATRIAELVVEACSNAGPSQERSRP